MDDEVKTDSENNLESANSYQSTRDIEDDAIVDLIASASDASMTESKEKSKRGRPSAYEAEYHNKVAHAMARAGLSEDVIASEMGISRTTMFDWKKKYPDFLDAITAGKELADSIVEASLYQRATGYNYRAVKIFMPANAAEPVYAPYIEHVPPDVGAAKHWLSNRDPDRWKDKVDIAVSGKVESVMPDSIIENLSSDAKAELAQAYAKALDGKH